MRTRRAFVAAPRLPEYDREGGSRRIWHLVEMLLGEGFAVSFFAENATGGERYARRLRQLGVAVYTGLGTSRAGDEYLPVPDPLVSSGRFDLAVLAFWNLAESLLPVFRTLSPRTKVLVDSVDLHFLRQARSAFQRGPDGERGELEGGWAEDTRRELTAYAGADAVLTVSRKEADLVDDLIGEKGHALDLPDTEDVELSPIPLEERRGLLFLGNYRHPPNVDAVEWLCREILPRVPAELLERHPTYIVGNDLNDRVRACGEGLPGVRMVGWVPTIAPYLAHARASLIPLRYGAGTKRKLIQAALAGTPSVSTSIGTEGLALEADRDVLVADDPAGFARGIERLLTEDETWRPLASRGRERMLAVHGRESVRQRLRDVLGRILEAPSSEAPAGWS